VKNRSDAMFVVLCLAVLCTTPDFSLSKTQERVSALTKSCMGLVAEEHETKPNSGREVLALLADNSGPSLPAIGQKSIAETARFAASESMSQSRNAEKSSASPDPGLKKQLIDAASRGDPQTVLRLLESGASIEARDPDMGGTPLIWASFLGHAPVVKLLLEKEAHCNVRNKEGWTPLLLSCAKGHVNIAKMLLEKGADIDARSSDGWTPLSIAFAKKNTELLKLLVYYCAKSPWATVQVKSVRGRECLAVRTQPSERAGKVRCMRHGEIIGLTGIWTNENWAQVCAPVSGWAFGPHIETGDLPDRKRAVLTLKPRTPRESPKKTRSKREQDGTEENLDIGRELDPQPGVPMRRHIWR
jgi:hypothetical protein